MGISKPNKPLHNLVSGWLEWSTPKGHNPRAAAEHDAIMNTRSNLWLPESLETAEKQSLRPVIASGIYQIQYSRFLNLSVPPPTFFTPPQTRWKTNVGGEGRYAERKVDLCSLQKFPK